MSDDRDRSTESGQEQGSSAPTVDPAKQQTRRDDRKLDLNAQGRQGSGASDRDQASNVGSGYKPDPAD